MEAEEPSTGLKESYARYANQDGSSLVADRLSQAQLRALSRWYRARTGGRRGRVLLFHAPVYDTVVQELVEGAFAEGGPLAVTETLFGLGLVVASWVRGGLDGIEGDGLKKAESLSLSHVVKGLAGFELAPSGHLPIDDPTELAQLTRRIERCDPRIKTTLRTIERLEPNPLRVRRVADRRRTAFPFEGRLMLFAGLVAGGLDIDDSSN